MALVRLTVSLLAPRICVVGADGKKMAEHYLAILNRRALEKGKRAYGPLGGAGSVAYPRFSFLVRKLGVSVCEPGSADLRLWVEEVNLPAVLVDFETYMPNYGPDDLLRELYQELGGMELGTVHPVPVLTREEIADIRIRYSCCVQQPRMGFVGSRRDEGVRTKRLFFLHELQVTPGICAKMQMHPVMREFDPHLLPHAQDPPAEPILLEDGSKLRGHMLRY